MRATFEWDFIRTWTVLLVLLILTACGGKTEQEHIESAKRYLEKNQYQSAIIELKSALEINLQNPQVRLLLGKTYLTLNLGSPSEKELRKAHEYGMDKEEILLPLAHALELQGKNQEILDEINAPFNFGQVDRARIDSLRGNAWLAMKKTGEAKKSYSKALEAYPQAPLAKLGFARIANLENNSEQAFQLINDALASSPNEPRLLDFLGDLYLEKNENAEAEKSFTKALENSVNNYNVLYKRAVLRILNKDLENAAKDVAGLVKIRPQIFNTFYARGLLALNQEKFPEAIGFFDKALNLGVSVQATYYRGLANFLEGNLEQAKNDLTFVVEKQPRIINSRQLLSRILYLTKEYSKSKEVLLPLYKSTPDDLTTLNLMTNIELALGQQENAIQHLKKILSVKPDAVAAQTQLGITLLKAGQKDEGIALLEKASKVSPDLITGDVYIFMEKVGAKQFVEAKEVLERIKTKRSDDLLVNNLQGFLYLAQGEKEKAKMMFEAVQKEDPANYAAVNQLVILESLENNDLGAIRKLYDSALKADPDNLEIALNLAELSAYEKKFEEMSEILKSVIEKHPKELEPRVLLSRYYSRVGGAGQAQTLLEEVKRDHNTKPMFWEALFEAQSADRRIRSVLDSAKKLVSLLPDSADAHFLLANAYERNGDALNSRKSLNKTLELSPDHIRAKMAEVKLAIFDKDFSKAQKKLDEIFGQYPKSSLLYELQAFLSFHAKDYEKSISFYQKFHDSTQSTRSATSLAQAYMSAGQQGAAISHLEEWRNQYPIDEVSRQLLSRLYLENGEKQKAKGELESMLETNPENPFILNEMAWFLHESEPAKALQYAEKAYEKNPENLQIVDTLIAVLLKTGDVRRARSVAETVKWKSGLPSGLKYRLAILEEKNGKIDEAISMLQQLLLENGEFEEKQSAETLLSTLQAKPH